MPRPESGARGNAVNALRGRDIAFDGVVSWFMTTTLGAMRKVRRGGSGVDGDEVPSLHRQGWRDSFDGRDNRKVPGGARRAARLRPARGIMSGEWAEDCKCCGTITMKISLLEWIALDGVWAGVLYGA